MVEACLQRESGPSQIFLHPPMHDFFYFILFLIWGFENLIYHVVEHSWDGRWLSFIGVVLSWGRLHGHGEVNSD